MNLWKNTALHLARAVISSWLKLSGSGTCQMPHNYPVWQNAKCTMCIHIHSCVNMSPRWTCTMKVNLHYQAQLLKRKKKNQLYKSTKKTQGAETIAIFCYFFKLTYKYKKKVVTKQMWHFLCASLFTRAAVADKMILLFEPQEMKL